MRIAAFAHDMQLEPALGKARAAFPVIPEIRLQPVEQAFHRRRRAAEVHGADDGQLVGLVEQIVDRLHVVVEDAAAPQLAHLVAVVILEDDLGFRAAGVAADAGSHVDFADGHQEQLVFGALVDVGLEEHLRQMRASPARARRPYDDDAFHVASKRLQHPSITPVAVYQWAGAPKLDVTKRETPFWSQVVWS